MNTKKVAFPSTEEGLNKPISGHFGHASIFTVVEYDEETKQIIKTEAIKNPPHEHGGCMRPVMILKNYGVDAIVLMGIGQRPYLGFLQQGVKVYRGIEGTVAQNFEAFMNNKLDSPQGPLCNHH